MPIIPKPAEVNIALHLALLRLVGSLKSSASAQGRELTDCQIAEMINVSPNYLSRMLSGSKGIGDEIVNRIDTAYPGWREYPDI